MKTLNKYLVERMQLTDAAVEHIRKLHNFQDMLLKEMASTQGTDAEALRFFADVWTSTQFALQRAWGFDEDADWHRFWRLPHCSCPCMDNDDSYPSGYYTVNSSCIIHGLVPELDSELTNNWEPNNDNN